MSLNIFFFFFSSRRRHTRSLRDWSSDVCSSDLDRAGESVSAAGRAAAKWLSSTSNRTFVLWPILLYCAEAASQQGIPWIEIWGLPLLAWGYLQYRLVGNYRLRSEE